MASKMKLTSNFRAAKDAGHDALQELIEKGTEAMHETAEARLEKGASRRGYDLPRDVEKDVGRLDGKISYAHWYGHFFEYGTTFIAALPFIRPGHRAGRKVVKDKGTASAIFEKWMRRKVHVR